MGVVQQVFAPLADVPVAVLVTAGALLIGLVYVFGQHEGRYPNIPEVKLDEKEAQAYRIPSHAWLMQARALIKKGLREYSSCFQVLTGSGYKVVVPSRFADELKNNPDLNFGEAFAKDLFVNYPGFDGNRQGLKEETFIPEVVRVKLTQSLGLITNDLVEETTLTIDDVLANPTEWETRPVKQDLLDIVARLSARVFMGPELCRNKDWLRISKEYTVDVFGATDDLKMCHPLLRPFQYWFIPSCTRLRQEVRDARALINPEVQRRRERAEAALATGAKPPKSADAISWMVECTPGRKIDYVAAQRALTTAAIHTTSESMTKCILQLCDTPEIVQPLRDEVISVLRADGWSKTSLYKMRLLDSFLKEVQRTNAPAFTSMNRLVKKKVVLSDGTVLPAGCRIMVSDDKGQDSSVYTDPDTFDVQRFLKMRSLPGEENHHQFVTTSATQMGFGHGQHACPGRFFAANEIKIALCHLLLKYDWRFPPGKTRREPDFEFETQFHTNASTQLQFRRRMEEIPLN